MRKDNIQIPYKNKVYTVKDFSLKFDIPEKTLRTRIYKGWDIAKIIATPVKKYNLIFNI